MAAPTPSRAVSWRSAYWRPLLFVLGLAVLGAPLYAVGSQRYQPSALKQDRAKLAKMASGRAIVLGSSHGYDVIPNVAGLRGQNFAHDGQDVFEMAHIARFVKEHAPKLDTVLVTVSYFTFALDNAAYLERGVQTRIGKRLDLYTAFPSFQLVPGDGASWLKGLLAPVVTRDHWQRVLVGHGRRAERPRPPEDDDDDDDDERGDEASPDGADNIDNIETDEADSPKPPRPAKKARTKKSDDRLTRHAKYRCRTYKRLMDNMRLHHPKLEEDAFDTLDELASELETAGIRVVLLTPPYFEAYSACFDKRRQALTRRNAQLIAEKNGAEYIDASRDEEFSSRRELFQDSDHLNQNGKQAFSRWLKGKLARR